MTVPPVRDVIRNGFAQGAATAAGALVVTANAAKLAPIAAGISTIVATCPATSAIVGGTAACYVMSDKFQAHTDKAIKKVDEYICEDDNHSSETSHSHLIAN